MIAQRILFMLAGSVLILALMAPALSMARSGGEARAATSFITTPGILDFGSLGRSETASVTLYFHHPDGVEGSPWHLEASASWVILDRTSGQFSKSVPHRVTVTASPRSLDPGMHWAHVVLTGGGAEPLHVPVLLHVEEKRRDADTGSLQHLVIEPVRPAPLAPGLNRVFRASGRFEDGRTLDVTSQARWVCDDRNIAEFLEPGVLQARAKGVARVRAEKDGIRSEYISLIVDDPEGPLIALSGPDASLGRMEVNATKELSYIMQNRGTGLLTWRASSSVPWISVVSGGEGAREPVAGSGILPGERRSLTIRVNTRGLDAGVYEGALVISSNGGDRVVAVTMAVATVEEVLLTPLMISVPHGQSRRLSATAVWSDGSRSDVSSSREGRWVNSNPSVASFHGRSGLFTARSPGFTEVKRVERDRESASALIEVIEIDPRARLRATPHEVDLGTLGPGEASGGQFQLRRSGDDAITWELGVAGEWKASHEQGPLTVVMTENTRALGIRLRSTGGEPVETRGGRGLFDLELVLEPGGGESAVFHRRVPEGFYQDQVVLRLNDHRRTLFFAYQVSPETSRPVLRLEPRVLNLGVLEPGKVYMPKISVSNEGKSMLTWNADVQGSRASFYDVRLPRGMFISLYNEKTGDDQFYSSPGQVADAVSLSGWWRAKSGYPERFAKNDSLTFSFEGTGVAVSVFTSPGAGSFRAYVNDTYAGEIDCAGPSDERKEVMLAGNLQQGPQVLTLNAEREGPFRIEGFRVYGMDFKRATGNWIRLSPARGVTRTSPDSVSLIINPAELAAGQYRENILFDSDGGRAVAELFFEVREARTTALIPVHIYRRGEDRLYLSEALTLPDEVVRGYRKEEVAFTLFSAGTPGTAEFYAWHDPRNNSWFYSKDRTGDGREAAGYVFQGSLGNIAIVPIRETRELYRLYNPETRRHLYTTTLREESEQRRRGYRYDGIAGYVR